MSKQFKLIALLGLGLSLSVFSVRAQAADCTIDVQPIVAKLIDAQTAAATGKQDDALLLVNEAKAELEAIETACKGAAAPELKGTFEAPDQSFTFNYPDGWLVDGFTPTLDIFGAGGQAIIGSNEQALDTLKQSIDKLKLEPSDQAAMVMVGTPNTVLYGLGLYDQANALKDDSGITALTEFLQTAIKDGQVFEEVSDPTYTENSATFNIGNKTFDGVVLLKQLSPTKYSFILMVGDEGTLPAVSTLGKAIEASVK